MPCSFILSYELQIQRKCTHYRVSMDTVAYMATIRFYASSILLQYHILNALFYYGTMLNTIRMEPLSFLVQYLTWPNSGLVLGLVFFHASTLD
jgi:hypothetical protein